ncbi:MAG: response regulator [Thermodesulfobacteriota bacterium]|nr:response regulator [Thermodesulfobacteriota bacterium]
MKPFKTLIVEDEFTSRLLLQLTLEGYGEVHTAVNGSEAIEAVHLSIELEAPYNLICLDMKMPVIDGQGALKAIRELEAAAGFNQEQKAKIIMTTAVSDGKSIMSAFKEQCNAYLIKPVDRKKLLQHLHDFNFID